MQGKQEVEPPTYPLRAWLVKSAAIHTTAPGQHHTAPGQHHIAQDSTAQPRERREEKRTAA
jgi:hypothetical protein